MVLFFIKNKVKEVIMSVFIAVGVIGTLWTIAGTAMAYETFSD